MSIKALRRRAREAHHWLGKRCLPLWAEVGLAQGGGFVPAIGMNYRPIDEGAPAGGPASQDAMIALFTLAPRVDFDADRADWLIDAARAALNTGLADDPPAPTGARTLTADCAAFTAALASLPKLVTAPDTAQIMPICTAFDTLMDDFLTLEGGWIAGHDEAGLPLSDTMPTRLAEPVVAALGPLIELAET